MIESIKLECKSILSKNKDTTYTQYKKQVERPLEAHQFHYQRDLVRGKKKGPQSKAEKGPQLKKNDNMSSGNLIIIGKKENIIRMLSNLDGYKGKIEIEFI